MLISEIQNRFVFTGWVFKPIHFIGFDTREKVYLFADVRDGGGQYEEKGVFDVKTREYSHDCPLEFSIQSAARRMLAQASKQQWLSVQAGCQKRPHGVGFRHSSS